MKKVIYSDFENYKTEGEIIELIEKRKAELIKQGFDLRQIFEIIFKSEYFKSNFWDETIYIKLKSEYNETWIKYCRIRVANKTNR